MYWMGQTAFSTKAKASAMAQKLLEKRLIACANIIPNVSSKYWWKGKIESSNEAILQFKTRDEKVPGAIAFIEKNHEYDTPVIETWKIGKANFAGTKWVLSETKPKKTAKKR